MSVRFLQDKSYSERCTRERGASSHSLHKKSVSRQLENSTVNYPSLRICTLTFRKENFQCFFCTAYAPDSCFRHMNTIILCCTAFMITKASTAHWSGKNTPWFSSSWQTCLFPAVAESDFSRDCLSAADTYLTEKKTNKNLISLLQLPYQEKLTGIAAALPLRLIYKKSI